MTIAIITPALADANNGNWQTAQRWAGMLAGTFEVTLAKSSDALGQPLQRYQAMIALHARRSAASVAAFAAVCPDKPLWVVLTGTDLYRDIASDPAAQASLRHATRLIVLQEHGVFDLPLELRHKAQVVFQSTPAVQQLRPIRNVNGKNTGSENVGGENRLRIAVIGHIRAEKSPETTLAVAKLLAHNTLPSRVQHAGRMLDARYTNDVQTLMNTHPEHYQWLDGLDHAQSLALIANSDVLFHPSAMEGGALAIIEAVQCGTPVIASRVAGHIGLLGADYLGFFEWGDAPAAAALLERFAQDTTFAACLQAQCAARSRLFNPETERRTLLNLLTI